MNDRGVLYFDHNAATPVAPEAVAAMIAALGQCYGNPSSVHTLGQAAKSVVTRARGEVALLVGASQSEIVFTSGATEANHLAVLGALAMQPHKRHLVMSAVEHPSLISLARQLRQRDIATSWIPVDAAGRIDTDQVLRALRPDTALISVMWANNETGVISPVADIAAVARSSRVPFHCDATQAAGRVPIDFAGSGIDLLSLSAHKLHGPKGVGALCVRKGIGLPPLINGHQERGRRGGTENVPGIAGFGAAARVASGRVMADASRIESLRDALEAALRQRFSEATINGCGANRLPNTTNVRFATLDAEMVLSRLNRVGVCASSGSACTATATEPSHVLLAMGQTREQALAAVRLSLGRTTIPTHIDRLLDALTEVLRPARERAA
ncbi:MAG: cysteine desulfurase [Sterolibacteriaceae bacterium]|uniref:cysteine desulfurase n=1 Tax=Candidatus Methylophosphatis roskildensis TaxID=2899263 RepID=A0A9D7E0E4_9PROT|nr:cysteine desulfurase [Candidatus Methylophosphatis roskildensis]MBK7665717.1 cysteine desulfurase [Sterolibacteriaceae bacterium]MBK9085957.1 cysteine desulfurase [Sterolibacteriaceae bacterium]